MGVALIGYEVMKHVIHDSLDQMYLPHKHGSLNHLLLFTLVGPDQEEVEQIVNKVTKITDCVHFLPSDIESDSDGGYFLSVLLSFYFPSRKKTNWNTTYHICCAKWKNTELVLK